TLHAAFVRSPIANGVITDLDLAAVARRAGFEALSFQDVAGISWDHLIPELPKLRPLADRRVRYQGEPVAAVLSPDRHAAHDALDDVAVDYEDWPAAVEPLDAMRADAPLVYEEMGTNIVYRSVNECEPAVFDGADVVVERNINNHRIAPGMLEPRGILAIPDGDALVVYCSHQMPHRLRDQLAGSLEIDPSRIRVIAPDVGGGFGAKGGLFYPEYPLVAAAALRFGRPVKYIETRSENLVVTSHGRGHRTTVGVGASSAGELVGLRVRTVGDLGAAAVNQRLCLANTQLMAAGCYRIPRIDLEILGVLTNTAPVGAFRGAGRPEAAYAIERIIDHLARELDIDPVEIRRRNFIEPDEFPHTTAVGAVYDSGRYAAALDVAVERADYAGLRQAQRESNSDRWLGVGVASYVEVTARGGEFGEVQMDGTGAVTVKTGSSPHGQGHRTTWAQIVADELGVAFEDITVVHGDTALVPRGWGTAGSRSAPLAGTAVGLAATEVADRLRDLAADRLEAAPDDVILESGHARVAGTDIGISLASLAAEAGGLEAQTDFVPEGAAYPFGTHVCAVEIDPTTGNIEIITYVAVDDVGRVINPIITEGQIHGGVSHGITHALFEQVRFDEGGTLLTGNWQSYRIPSISDVVEIDAVRTQTPSPLNPKGMKGVGEPGTTGATPALVNAVFDAVARLGITDDDLPMPFTPDKVWAVLRGRT
ncbi:MAG: xanthine dehydrogenase family protein molybdopterin-binding subunit, partial [Acidimicrobiia bacterium]|nr:xanthine dehydrogenase family protein molybdopterin-binding subunit [Acidimicrobiia bacterium]